MERELRTATEEPQDHSDQRCKHCGNTNHKTAACPLYVEGYGVVGPPLRPVCEECGKAIKGTPWQLGFLAPPPKHGFSWECLCADCVVRIIPGYFKRPL